MSKRFRAPIAACVAMLGLLRAADAQDAQNAQNPRIALVIGESTYLDKTLPTSANDAGLVAQVLQAAGFDVVGARDLDSKSVRAALRDFLDKANAAGPNMQAFVYFAGRAVQYEGDNFLVPIDARIDRPSDAPIEGVRLTDFTHGLAAAPGVARIVVVDGARANPFANGPTRLAGGLALVDPDNGELIAFNAAPGSIGADEAGPYGVYAKTLAGAMREGGVDVADVFAQTRVAVNNATAGAQIPWDASKLAAPYFIFERAADAPPPKEVVALAEARRRPIKSFPVEQAYAAAIERDNLPGYEEFLVAYPDSAEARRIRAILAARREALFWRRARAEDDPRGYWTYLQRYPKGPHAYDAGLRLRRLSAHGEPPRDFAPVVYDDLPPPPPAEMVYADRPVYMFDGPDFGPPPPPPPYGFVAYDDDWRDLPPPPPPPAVGVLPALAIAIPLLLTARAYRAAPHPNGLAAVGAPPPRPAPAMAPPLPSSVRPRPAAPAPAAANPAPAPAAAPARPAPPVPAPAAAPAAAAAPAHAAPPPAPAPAAAPAHAAPPPAPAPAAAAAPAHVAPPPAPAHAAPPPAPAPAAAPAHAAPPPAPAAAAAPAHVAPPPAPAAAAAPAHIAPPPAPAPAAAPAHVAPPPAPAAAAAPARPAPPPSPAHVAPPPAPAAAIPAPAHIAPPCGKPGEPACPK